MPARLCCLHAGLQSCSALAARLACSFCASRQALASGRCSGVHHAPNFAGRWQARPSQVAREPERAATERASLQSHSAMSACGLHGFSDRPYQRRAIPAHVLHGLCHLPARNPYERYSSGGSGAVSADFAFMQTQAASSRVITTGTSSGAELECGASACKSQSKEML